MRASLWRPGLRVRLTVAALVLVALAVLAAGISLYGLTRTQALAGEALAAQRRIEAYGVLSARVNAWVLSSFAPEGDPQGAASVREALGLLDGLVADDVRGAPSAEEAARRGRQGAMLAGLRRQVEQLEAALAMTAPGTAARDASLAFFSADLAPSTAAAVQEATQRRDGALAAMEQLRRRLTRAAIGIALAAPAVLVGLYLALLRPLFARLAAATAEAGGIAAGAPAAGAGGHDEFGLLLARLRLTAMRLARDRARLGATVAEQTAELREANERLSRADVARRRFFADVSHELRTPLTVILGEAELGMAHADAAVRASLATIRGRAGRLSRRIEDLLRIARSETGQLELARDPVDLEATVRAAVTDVTPLLARAGVTVDLKVPPLVVAGDGDWLRQVFSGLLENAAKYAGRGACVRITARGEAGEAVVALADDGPGLPPERLGAIFERFGREASPAPQPGFGVGLALARWVVESLGGSLVAVAPDGGGLTLAMRLPLAETEAAWLES